MSWGILSLLMNMTLVPTPVSTSPGLTPLAEIVTTRMPGVTGPGGGGGTGARAGGEGADGGA
jgi:hypothetical protein